MSDIYNEQKRRRRRKGQRTDAHSSSPSYITHSEGESESDEIKMVPTTSAARASSPVLRISAVLALLLLCAALLPLHAVSVSARPQNGGSAFLQRRQEASAPASAPGVVTPKKRDSSSAAAAAAPVRPRITRRDWTALSDGSLRSIAGLSDPSGVLDHRLPSSLLSRILIPRAPDTANSTLVREAILSVFRERLGADAAKGRSGWHVETPTFSASTPQGSKRMTNMVFTKDPRAPRRLVLAAHYDSKWFAPGSGMEGFVGATDSAAPVAMLVDVALALDALLDAREARIRAALMAGREEEVLRERVDETTLQIILLDGEEAYGAWSDSDSIYGAKNLVQSWTTHYTDPPVARSLSSLSDSDCDRASVERSSTLEARRFKAFTQPVRRIDTIEHFVLLDLLGAKNPTVPSYFPGTEWLHSELATLERRMRKLDALAPAGEKAALGPPFLSSNKAWGGIEDDHLPFLRNGVPILHMITNPFPHVWHRLSDDASALDYPTVRGWAFLMRAFVAEYLGLDVPAASADQREDRKRQATEPQKMMHDDLVSTGAASLY